MQHGFSHIPLKLKNVSTSYCANELPLGGGFLSPILGHFRNIFI